MTRSVPVPSELTRPFWQAARDGRLVVPACRACGLRFFTPEPVCPGCWSADWTWQPCSGRGRVYSVTVVHRAPGPDFDVPFALAVVDLDEGAAMLTHVLGVPPDEVVIGMRVAVDFRIVAEGMRLPYFVPEAD
ncbi:OB-fold domain-containing protein [Streptomyces sp. NPDC044571]|uniref:Zn-ribbon domain-containing OB-fold protein n=1 Tax=Streptomyces sp. NPDC044571 TaxID=3155371 RepID=UPI0033FDD72E